VSGDVEIRDIIEELKEELTPSPEERVLVKGTISEAVGRLKSALADLGLPAEPTPVGSAVRDTWLPGKADIDIFLLFPLDYPSDELGPATLAAAERAFGAYKLRYASHPYAVVELNGFEIDVVPAYRISNYTELRSPVDRTPLHNRFLLERLNDRMRSEIRLLKAFLRGIGAYGAELAVGGFSGYLAELLILKYGSFLDLVKSASAWRPPVSLTLEGEPPDWVAESESPLIFVDPVDPRRNVASAVTETQLNRFRSACSAFLKQPSREFFTEKTLPPVSRQELARMLKDRGTTLLLVLYEGLAEPPDTLWSQAISGAFRLKRALEEAGFNPLQAEGWTDETSRIALVLEVERAVLPVVEKRVGPEVGGPGEAGFLKKHLGARDTLGGPFIEGSRWVAFKARRLTSLRDVVEELTSGVESILPKLLRGSEPRILLQDDSDFPGWDDLLPFLGEFLRRRRDFFAERLVPPED